jgi:hypothetical protein
MLYFLIAQTWVWDDTIEFQAFYLDAASRAWPPRFIDGATTLIIFLALFTFISFLLFLMIYFSI